MAPKGAMLKGAKSKFWRHFENILLAGPPRAVPTAFLPCQSSVCCTCCQQQVRTCVFYWWQNGDAQEEPLCTAAGVNVSISKCLIYCQGMIVSFCVANNSPLYISFICKKVENLVTVTDMIFLHASHAAHE